jgi:tRNA threonylcarbamoyladenosine biosynthesis protein TsaB
MALILCLETATEVCSVALFRDKSLLGIKESGERNVHSSMLTVFIEAVTRESGISLNEIDAVAISMGPGSYTGLRIGVASAKGLCYALEIPLIAVPTLQAMAMGIHNELKIKNYELREPYYLCPMIDARRMEVYCALYDELAREAEPVRAEVIDENSFRGILKSSRIFFGGEGAEKCREALGPNPNAVFLDRFRTSARFMIDPATAKYDDRAFEDLAYFEPFYLKDFVAGKPRVKGLR